MSISFRKREKRPKHIPIEGNEAIALDQFMVEYRCFLGIHHSMSSVAESVIKWLPELRMKEDGLTCAVIRPKMNWLQREWFLARDGRVEEE